MEISNLLLILFSITELVLLSVVIFFFVRLKKSEALVANLQARQEEFVNKLMLNAQLEQELVQTFEARQKELTKLDQQLEEKALRLKKIVKQAQNLSNSPQFLRQTILSGHKNGRSVKELAEMTDLSRDEVELIIDQETP